LPFRRAASRRIDVIVASHPINGTFRKTGLSNPLRSSSRSLPVFAFPAVPAVPGTDLLQRQMETQLSLFSSMVGGMLDASLQFSKLNTQAARKLVEESVTAVEKGLALRTVADTQAFMLEQSQLGIERVRGYRRNAQAIITERAPGIRVPVTDAAAAQSARPAQAAAPHDADNGTNGGAPHAHPHEVDPHPSPLVEKLISTVVDDAKPH